MHIYAFGSICRGDVDRDSDVDLLALVSTANASLDPNVFSIYSYARIKELWAEGNPFAWHLMLESKMLFSADDNDFIKSLGRPEAYRKCASDCEKFLKLFLQAQRSLTAGKPGNVFELSVIFLSIRNIASCFSLGVGLGVDFSRRSAFALGNKSVPISEDIYRVLLRCRVLSTRGKGIPPGKTEITLATLSLSVVNDWMVNLVEEAKEYERIH